MNKDIYIYFDDENTAKPMMVGVLSGCFSTRRPTVGDVSCLTAARDIVRKTRTDRE
jgi:hypothetical protein